MWLQKRSGTQALGTADCVTDFLAEVSSVIFYWNDGNMESIHSFYNGKWIKIVHGDLIFASVLQ